VISGVMAAITWATISAMSTPPLELPPAGRDTPPGRFRAAATFWGRGLLFGLVLLTELTWTDDDFPAF
jgi:hypothetical protein